MAKPTAPCFVCERVRHFEMHHVPPKEVGGTLMVPLCLSCHEHVDRTPLDRWPSAETLAALHGLWGKLNEDERLLAMKLVRIMADVAATSGSRSSRQAPLAPPDHRWNQWSPRRAVT